MQSICPHVVIVPIAIDGRGRDGVYQYYHDYFLARSQLTSGLYPSRRSSEEIFSPKRPSISLSMIKSWTG